MDKVKRNKFKLLIITFFIFVAIVSLKNEVKGETIKGIGEDGGIWSSDSLRIKEDKDLFEIVYKVINYQDSYIEEQTLNDSIKPGEKTFEVSGNKESLNVKGAIGASENNSYWTQLLCGHPKADAFGEGSFGIRAVIFISPQQMKGYNISDHDGKEVNLKDTQKITIQKYLKQSFLAQSSRDRAFDFRTDSIYGKLNIEIINTMGDEYWRIQNKLWTHSVTPPNVEANEEYYSMFVYMGPLAGRTSQSCLENNKKRKE